MPAVQAARAHKGTVVIDFRVEQEDTRVPDGAGRRRPRRDDPPAQRRWPRREPTDDTTFVAHVEDKPGVLNRVASLFRRRAFNIESLTVGHTETAGISRMTIVVETDDDGAHALEANLYKLVNVLRVDNVTDAAGGRRATWR